MQEFQDTRGGKNKTSFAAFPGSCKPGTYRLHPDLIPYSGREYEISFKALCLPTKRRR
ncbi:hypothetical protein NPIL_126291, partial [Nephila pilipes]